MILSPVMSKVKDLLTSIFPDDSMEHSLHRKKMKKKIFFILRIAVSAGLIGYFLFSLSRQQGGLGTAVEKILSAFSSASLAWLIPAAMLHIVGFSLISLRWKLMLKAQNIHSSFAHLFMLYLMAAFFNLLLPSTIGGDTVRAIESRRITRKTSVSVMVVIMERITGMVALVLIASMAFLIESAAHNHLARGLAIFLIALGAISLATTLAHPGIAPVLLRLVRKVMPGKIHKLVEGAYQSVSIYFSRPVEFFFAQAVSIVFQINMVIYYYFIARALHQNPDFVDFMIKVPIMIFLLMIIPAVNGLGVRTASFRGLMKFSAAFAISGEFIDLGMRVAYGIIGGIIFLIYRRPDSGQNPEKDIRV
jgi:uncharacterized protein (TIRG00374 family)